MFYSVSASFLLFFFVFLKQLFLFRCLHWFLATQRTHIQSWYFFRFLKTMEVLVSGIFLPVVIRTQARVWHFCWTLIFFLATYLERIFFSWRNNNQIFKASANVSKRVHTNMPDHERTWENVCIDYDTGNAKANIRCIQIFPRMFWQNILFIEIHIIIIPKYIFFLPANVGHMPT